MRCTLDAVADLERVRVIGDPGREPSGIVSIAVDGIHPYDVGGHFDTPRHRRPLRRALRQHVPRHARAASARSGCRSPSTTTSPTSTASARRARDRAARDSGRPSTRPPGSSSDGELRGHSTPRGDQGSAARRLGRRGAGLAALGRRVRARRRDGDRPRCSSSPASAPGTPCSTSAAASASRRCPRRARSRPGATSSASTCRRRWSPPPARRRTASPNVEFVLGDVETATLPPRPFDIALSRWGLMFAADRVELLRVVAGLLKPGGVLAAAVWGEPAARAGDQPRLPRDRRAPGARAAAAGPGAVHDVGPRRGRRRGSSRPASADVEIDELVVPFRFDSVDAVRPLLARRPIPRPGAGRSRAAVPGRWCRPGTRRRRRPSTSSWCGGPRCRRPARRPGCPWPSGAGRPASASG